MSTLRVFFMEAASGTYAALQEMWVMTRAEAERLPSLIATAMDQIYGSTGRTLCTRQKHKHVRPLSCALPVRKSRNSIFLQPVLVLSVEASQRVWARGGMADARGLGPREETLAGSSPVAPTNDHSPLTLTPGADFSFVSPAISAQNGEEKFEIGTVLALNFDYDSSCKTK